MEVLLATIFLETVLLNATSHIVRTRRKYFLMKWARGEMTMKELLWLKRQPWFQRGFKKVKVEPTKKND
jgi:hypothetical protein